MKKFLLMLVLALAIPMLVCTPVSAQTPHNVALKWKAPVPVVNPDVPPSPTTYNVYRTQTSGGSYVQINEAPVTAPEYVDYDVVNGLVYYYVVRAECNGLESENSNEATAVIPPSPPIINPPNAPQDLEATVGVGGKP